MKKLVLSLALSAMAALSMSAGTDGQTYEQVGDYKLVNDWIISRVHTGELAYNALPFANNYARRATIYNGEVLIAQTCSPQYTYQINDTTTGMQCVIFRYSVEDGTPLDPVPVKLNGAPYGNTAQASLLANNIGVDHFGHLWLAQYASEATRSFQLYQLDIETGELTSMGTLIKAETEEEVCARIDYIDVMGDITREEAQCNVMGCGANSDLIYRWHADQGAEWEPGFDGVDYHIQIVEFPKGWNSETQSNDQEVASWGFAPFIKMCLGEDEESDDYYNGDLFWIDGFYSAPALYMVSGTMYDTFNNVSNWDLLPEAGTNGLTEFHLDGKNFMIYSIRQYQGDGHGCQANIVELDESLALESMVKYWQIPADSLGHTSASGIRIHSLEAIPGVDEEGNEYVTILTYKCQNGFGIYRMGKNVKPHGGVEPGVPGDVDGSGNVDVDDLNLIINMMLGKADKTPAGDVTGDGNVDVDDMNAIINIMLGKV
ncbi:MAG: dockerin type I repeat-containing protein [Muribaculaceae bacterium]|nr:dockerin type I repeat-containing protein [Muribaculaceae bacterium]